MAISHCCWDVVVKNGNFTLVTDIKSSKMAISQFYWHLVVNEWQFHIVINIYWFKNGNFTLLLTASGQEWQFHSCYWHLVVRNGNFTLLLISIGQQNVIFTLLLTCSGQELQFHITTYIKRSRFAISHCYWYIEVKFVRWQPSSSDTDPPVPVVKRCLEYQYKKCYQVNLLVVMNGTPTLLLTCSSQK